MPEIYVSTDVETNGPIPGHQTRCSASGRAPTCPTRRCSAPSPANLHLLPGERRRSKHHGMVAREIKPPSMRRALISKNRKPRCAATSID